MICDISDIRLRYIRWDIRSDLKLVLQCWDRIPNHNHHSTIWKDMCVCVKIHICKYVLYTHLYIFVWRYICMICMIHMYICLIHIFVWRYIWIFVNMYDTHICTWDMWYTFFVHSSLFTTCWSCSKTSKNPFLSILTASHHLKTFSHYYYYFGQIQVYDYYYYFGQIQPFDAWESSSMSLDKSSVL